MNTSNEQPIAVVDTNVMLDVYSCHDLSGQYDKGEDVAGPNATYRRARARESLLLAIYLHSIRATTYGLHHEVPRMLTQMVDPESSKTLETNFTTLFLHFVKDEVLSGWDARCVIDWDKGDANDAGEDGFSWWDQGLKGDDADDRLLLLAKETQVPLITNEGFGVKGVKNRKLRKRAKAEGVVVFTPEEFYRGKLDEDAETRAFLKSFANRAPRYIEEDERKFGPSEIRDFLLHLLGVYEHILLGKTKDHGVLPVRVGG